jgi:hypothetical protein
MNREDIYSALFERLKAAYPWQTASRVLAHWSDVSPAQQPALFMTQVGERAVTETRQPARWFLEVKIYLYANAKSQGNDVPATVLNAMLDAVTTAMKPDHAAVDTQTLGDLVSYARIEGDLTTDEGLLGEQAVAIIPIMILTAD